MGLLDHGLGQGASSGIHAFLAQQVIAMLTKPGALSGFMEALQRQGLGKALQSWIGTGQNLPIAPEQVKNVLGHGTIAELAKKAGIGESDTASVLSTLLPQIIDQISPQGQAPTADRLTSVLGSIFRT